MSIDRLERLLPPTIIPPVGPGTTHPSSPCVSYEATKRESRWQRVYGVGLHRPPVLPLHKLKKPRDAGPKRCHYSQTSRAQHLLHMVLTGLHHSPVVGIPLLLPSNSSIFPPAFPANIIITVQLRVSLKPRYNSALLSRGFSGALNRSPMMPKAHRRRISRRMMK